MVRAKIVEILSHKYFVCICLLVSVAVRLLWLGVVRVGQISDWQWYYDRGVSIAAGHGYYVNGIPTSYWPVGYPAFLGGLFYLVGPHVLAGQLANIVEWVGGAFLTYLFVKKVFRAELAARLALLIVCFHPNTIAYTTFLTADMFLAFLLLLGAVLFVYAEGRWISFVMAGLVWGVATLTKPQSFAMPAIFILLFLRDRKQILKAGVLLYAMVALAVVPWLARNERVLGKPVIANNGGIVLMIGNNPHSNGRQNWDPETQSLLGDLAADEDHMFDGREVERDARARDVAMTWIKHHPFRALALWPKKFKALYLSDVEGIYYALDVTGYLGPNRHGVYVGLRIIGEIYYLAMLALFVASVPLIFKSGRPDYAAGLIVCLYFTLVYMVFMGDPRYHFALVPWIAMYAGISAAYLLSSEHASLKLSKFSTAEYA
jgi:4-amino-4-deoxy-L-arabinose transferase-like glycosyltransferase